MSFLVNLDDRWVENDSVLLLLHQIKYEMNFARVNVPPSTHFIPTRHFEHKFDRSQVIIRRSSNEKMIPISYFDTIVEDLKEYDDERERVSLLGYISIS